MPSAVATVVFAVFIGYYGWLCLRPEWGGDFQMYCAGIARLYRNFLHPLHEALPVPGPQSTVYTLYLVAVALFGKLLGLDAYQALQWSGLANLCGLVAASCFLFSRWSIHRRWSLPAACFLVSWLLVQWHHYGWSSALSLTNLQYIQAYPSTAAWSLAFLAFGLLAELEQERRARDLVALILVLLALLLTHGLTASWVIGITGLFALWTCATERSLTPLGWCAVAVGCASGLGLAWPYSPLWGQQSHFSVYEGAPFGDFPPTEFPNVYGIGLAAFAYLGWRVRRHGFWFAGLLATLGALAVWHAADFNFGTRYALFSTFFLHFAIAEVMALAVLQLLRLPAAIRVEPQQAAIDRYGPRALLAVACVSWLPSPMRFQAQQTKDFGTLAGPSVLWNRPPPGALDNKRFSPLTSFLGTRHVVLMPASRDTFTLATVTGASTVAAPNALGVPDHTERMRAAYEFFKPHTQDRRRRQLAFRYNATHILVPAAYFARLPALSRVFGKPLYRDPTCALLGVGP